MSATPEVFAPPRLSTLRWASVPVGVFYVTLAAASLHLLSSQSLEAALLGASLALAVLVAPLEHAVGAWAAAFLAAASSEMRNEFLLVRWLVLAFSIVALTLRFFLRRHAGSSHLTKFTYLLLAFLGVSAVTTTTTMAPVLTDLKLGAVICVFYLSSGAAVRLVENYGPSSARKLTGGLLAYALAFVAAAAPGYLMSPADSTRFFGNPNTWAALLATVLPWAASPLFRRVRQTGVKLGALAGCFIFGCYLLLLSGSRAAMLGVLLAVTVFCLIHANRKVGAAVLLASVLITARVLASPDTLSNFTRQYLYKHKVRDAQTNLFESRVQPWEAAMANFREHPWLGLGFGVTNQGEAAWSAEVGSWYATETGGSFWGTLSQVGAVGSAPLFLAILILLIEAGRFAWKVKDPWLTGVYGSVLALTVNAIFEGWLIAPGNFIGIYFWVQCFFLNALMCRFRPAPSRFPALSVPPASAWDSGSR